MLAQLLRDFLGSDGHPLQNSTNILQDYERNVVEEVIDDSVVNLEQGYVQISACEGEEVIHRSQIKQFWCNERIAYRSWLELENQWENNGLRHRE